MTKKQARKPKPRNIREGSREQILEIMKTVRDHDFTRDEMDLLLYCIEKLRDVGLTGIIAEYAGKPKL